MDDLVGYEEWLVRVGRAETVEGETTGKTGDGTEKGLESLGHVVRDEVFVDLHHGDDGPFRIGQRSFSTDGETFLVVNHPARPSAMRHHALKPSWTYAEIKRLTE